LKKEEFHAENPDDGRFSLPPLKVKFDESYSEIRDNKPF
jgi:hypothetical protein